MSYLAKTGQKLCILGIESEPFFLCWRRNERKWAYTLQPLPTLYRVSITGGPLIIQNRQFNSLNHANKQLFKHSLTQKIAFFNEWPTCVLSLPYTSLHPKPSQPAYKSQKRRGRPIQLFSLAPNGKTESRLKFLLCQSDCQCPAKYLQ